MNINILLEESEIKNRLDRIAYYTDFKRVNDVLDFFTQDASYSIDQRGHTLLSIKGKEEIEKSLSLLEEQKGFLFHLLGTKIVEVDPMKQTATSNCCAIVRQGLKAEDSNQITQYLEYRDSWIKVEDVWYLISRAINVLSDSSERKSIII